MVKYTQALFFLSHNSTEVIIVRYFYEKPQYYKAKYGMTYECNHPVYDKCTLYKINDRGLGVIQQRYDQTTKRTWWGEIDTWLIDDIYLHPKFKQFFEERSGTIQNGIYPTVSIRQVMWALKMKPIPRQRWETCFDRRNI